MYRRLMNRLRLTVLMLAHIFHVFKSRIRMQIVIDAAYTSQTIFGLATWNFALRITRRLYTLANLESLFLTAHPPS